MLASLPMCRSVLRLLGLTKFSSMALPLSRLQSYPLEFWLRGEYKFPADLFKSLMPSHKARSKKSSALVVPISAKAKIDTSCLSGRESQQMLPSYLNLVLQRQVARKEEKGDKHQSFQIQDGKPAKSLKRK